MVTEEPRVLIVDDEEHIRFTLLEVMASMDLPAETAASGQEALEKLDAGPFNLVLLDLKMPGMNGMDVLHEITYRFPNVPVVIITAHGDIETAVEALQIGALNFIQKPFSLPAIRKLVAEMIDPMGREKQAALRYESLIRRAKVCVEERRLAAALEHARQALALEPARPEAFNIMGVVMQLKMDVTEAQKYYRSALALDDAYAPARENLERLSSFPKKLSRFVLE